MDICLFHLWWIGQNVRQMVFLSSFFGKLQIQARRKDEVAAFKQQ